MSFLPEIVFSDPKRQEEIKLFFEEWFNEKDFMEVKSSGSTGDPKVIKIKKEHMLISARKTIQFFDLKENDTCLLCLSTATIGGKMMLVRAIAAKLKVIVGKVAAFALEDLSQKIKFAAIVPLQLDYQLHDNPSKLHFIEHLIVGGAPIQPNTINLLKANKLTVYQTFGMTETISHVALKKVGFEGEEYYHGLDNIQFSVEEDRLVINYPEIDIHHLKSTDLVELISPTSFKWLGRADFVINSGAYKFHPEQIEAKLSSLIHQAYFIHGLPDEKLGQRIVLFVEQEANFTKDDLKKVLEKYEVPKEIRVIPKFIRTKSDKINRLATIARF